MKKNSIFLVPAKFHEQKGFDGLPEQQKPKYLHRCVVKGTTDETFLPAWHWKCDGEKDCEDGSDEQWRGKEGIRAKYDGQDMVKGDSSDCSGKIYEYQPTNHFYCFYQNI